MPAIREGEPLANADVRIERILCPVDFSDVSAKAYCYAQSIAVHYAAKLILQHVVELDLHPSAYYQVELDFFEDYRNTLISNAKEQLRQFADLRGGVEPESVVEESYAPEAILALAQARAANLIVMGTHGRRGLDHFMLGSVTERVLRRAACPVLAIPGKAAAGNGKASDPVMVRRVLCCVDFSAHSERALDHAFSVARAYAADLSVLHVLDNTPESDDVGKDTAAAMEKLQELVAAREPDPAKVDLQVRLGKAYREILDFSAEEHPDLIVTGVRGRNSLNLAVFGSTTYRVLQLHAGPVLTVPI